MATIAELIVACGVDPAGIKTGLDQGAGYLRQFGKTAQQEIEETLKAFPAMGYKTAQEIGVALLGGLEPQFQNIQARLREQLARGVISRETFQREGALAAQAFNASLLIGIEELRGSGLMRAGDELETELVGKLKEAGIQAGRAFENGLGNSADRSLAGMGRIRQGLTSLIASYTGTIPVLDRISGQLATMGLGGNVALGAVAGIAAIAGAYHVLTKEAREASEAQDKAVASLLEWKRVKDAGAGGKFDLDLKSSEKNLVDLRAQLAALNTAASGSDVRYSQGRDGGAARQYLSAQEVAATKKHYDELSAAIAEGEAHVRDLKKKASNASAAEMVRDLAALITSGDASAAMRRNAELLVKGYNDTIRALRNDPSRMGDVTDVISLRDQLESALHPSQKGGHDRGPFADERERIGEVTTAFEALHKAGLPVGDLYEKLDAALRLVNFQLDQQTDKASAASNALRAIRADILATNFNADDPRLPHSAPIQLDSADDTFGKTVEAAIQHVQALRDSLGEMNGDTATAEAQLQHMLDGVNDRIQFQGGATRATNALLEIQRSLYKEIADEQQQQGKEVWSPEDAAEIARQIKIAMEALHGGTKDAKADFQEIATAVHGLVDSLAGLGVIGPGISQAATSALHAAESIRKMQEASASSKGLDTMGAITGTLGVVGGVIGAIGGLASLFNQHDAILEANNRRLEALRLSMVDTKGVSGQQAALSVASQWSVGIQNGTFNANDFDAFKKLLSSAGLTADQFDKIAADLGIDISKGTSYLGAFADALRAAIANANKFGTTYGDQTALEQLRLKIYGLSEPLDTLKSTLLLLGKQHSSLGTEFGLDTIDTSTKEGQDKLRKALEDMYEKLAAGLLTPEELGQFGGAKEFAAWLQSASDALDALQKSASAAAGAMLYVPTGYKLALDRFNAMDPMAPPTPMKPSGPLESTSGSGGVVAQVQSGSQSVTYQFNGPISIDARSKTAEETFAAVLKVAKRRAQTIFGDSTRWADVNV